MELRKFRQRGPYEWELPAAGRMRVPGVIFASRELMEAMDEKVAEQVANVASLPGIVAASYAMPDAHWGYGFPIGGVAASPGSARCRTPAHPVRAGAAHRRLHGVESSGATPHITAISILRGCACSAFGMRSFSAPCTNSAETLFASSSFDKVNTRR